MIARKHRPSARTTGKGHSLASALTQGQVEAVIDVMFRLLGRTGIEKLKTSVEREPAQVLERLFEPHRRKAPPQPTESKFALQWQEAWSRWCEATSDLGEEDGRYVYTERHWEPPYFDGSALAEELDEAAAEIRPLIERACALKIEERDFFKDELLAIDEAIGDFPEWMGSEECALGPVATSCILKWEWRAGAENGAGPKEFLERIGQIRNALRHVTLDSEAFVEFFSALPALSQKATLQAFGKLKGDPTWRQRFVPTGSDWQQAERVLLSRHDRAAYLRESLERLGDQWRYGIPAIEHAVAGKDFDQAQEILTRTIASLLGSKKSETAWLPEEELIADRLDFVADPDRGDVEKLLSLAAKVSTGLGNAHRARVFELQKVVYARSEDWDAVVAEFRRDLASSIARQARTLLGRWETLMAEESFGWSARAKVTRDTWVHDLIEAAIDEARPPGVFQTRLTRKLETLAGHSGAITRERRIQIMVLADDLSAVTSMKKTHPRLAQVVRNEARGLGSDRLTEARRSWMGRMGVESITPAMLDFLRRIGPRLVPDPATAHGSRYDEQVSWIKGISEVDPDVARRILSRWESAHGRRRNLWAALKRAGFG